MRYLIGVTVSLESAADEISVHQQVDPDVARQAQHGHVSYMYAKTLAEKALWKFVEDEKPQFTVSVISASV